MNWKKELQSYPEKMRKCGKVISNAIAVVEECKIIADTLIDAADVLDNILKDASTKSEVTKKKTKDIEKSAPTTMEEAAEKSLTLVDVRAVLAAKSKAGFSSEVRTLIGKYGGDKLSDVPVENYAALIEEVEELTNA